MPEPTLEAVVEEARVLPKEVVTTDLSLRLALVEVP